MVKLKQLFSRRGRKRLLNPVDWGGLRRLAPVSKKFGFDRGTPIDRYYIGRFLQEYRSDIRGHVLEISESQYTRSFGGNQVSASDVLHATHDNPSATLVGDLATGDGIPRNEFDCFILTQTLQMIRDFPAAIEHARNALRPGGVVLASLPGISPISRYDMERWGDYWRFTNRSAKEMFAAVFGAAGVEVSSFGNILTATAFLHGLAAEELQPEELDFHDPDFEVMITVRAVRPA